MIRDACERVRSGSWTDEEFRDFLENQFQLFETKQGALVASFELNDLGMMGIHKIEEGLDLLYSYTEEGAPDSVLAEGLALLRQGEELLKRATDGGEPSSGAVPRSPRPKAPGPGDQRRLP